MTELWDAQYLLQLTFMPVTVIKKKKNSQEWLVLLPIKKKLPKEEKNKNKKTI